MKMINQTSGETIKPFLDTSRRNRFYGLITRILEMLNVIYHQRLVIVINESISKVFSLRLQ